MATFVFKSGNENYLYYSAARVDSITNQLDGFNQIEIATGRNVMPTKGNVQLYKGKVMYKLESDNNAVIVDCRIKRAGEAS